MPRPQTLFAILGTLTLTSILTTFTSTATATLIKCPIVFDGRVNTTLAPSAFDSAATSPFDPTYVKGAGLEWSEILRFPPVPAARFDLADPAAGEVQHKSVEVTISNASVFNEQTGFRRAGLLFRADNNTDGPGAVGVRTLHFSVMQDLLRPMNLSHEYLNVWHEVANYSANQFDFEAGTLIDDASEPRATFKLLNRATELVWQTPMLLGEWQNFAVTLDFDANTLQMHYSQGYAPLAPATAALPNDNSGGGQYQIGMLKKPTGAPATADIAYVGYQEAPFDEGQIYGGLFVENSAGGCISL